MDEKNDAKTKKGMVRVYITYGAGAYLLVGSTMLMLLAFLDDVSAEKMDAAKDVFVNVSPIAAGILTYWFTDRAIRKSYRQNNEEKDHSDEA